MDHSPHPVLALLRATFSVACKACDQSREHWSNRSLTSTPHSLDLGLDEDTSGLRHDHNPKIRVHCVKLLVNAAGQYKAITSFMTIER